MTRSPDQLRLQIDGPGAEPEIVNTRETLELALTYFDLLHRLAKSEGKDLDFKGVTVEHNCTSILAKPTSIDCAQAMAQLANLIVGGENDSPNSSVREDARRVRRSLRRLPDGQSARVFVRDWSEPLVTKKATRPQRFVEILELRVTPMWVGGVKPKVKLSSPSEDGYFALEVSREVAKRIAAFLYNEVDAALRVTRATGRIQSGTLTDFFPLEGAEPLEAIGAWAQDSVDWEATEAFSKGEK